MSAVEDVLEYDPDDEDTVPEVRILRVRSGIKRDAEINARLKHYVSAMCQRYSSAPDDVIWSVIDTGLDSLPWPDEDGS